MPLSVADKSGLLREGLPAYVADVRSFAGVNQYVLLLRGLSGKGFAADGTGERPDALMDPQMKIQVPLLTESLAAGGTDDFLFSLVPNQMLIQILLRGQTALAYLTLVSRLVVSILHVRFDGGEILTSMPADTADNGRFAAVHLIHVLLQIVLDLELFGADRTRVLEAAGVLSYEVILQGALVVALVLANATGIQKGSVDLFNVSLQFPLQIEALAAGLTLVFVLFFHVYYYSGFLIETLTAYIAFQGERRFFRADFFSAELLLFRIFASTMILLFMYFSFFNEVSFEAIWQ